MLQKFDTHSGVTTVYVTDYTANPLAYPLKATWCPPALYGCVFQCEMWDSARVVAKEMKLGEYWHLDNVRAKWNPARYVEGTMQLTQRTTRLDEMAGQDQTHLRALLVSVL